MRAKWLEEGRVCECREAALESHNVPGEHAHALHERIRELEAELDMVRFHWNRELARAEKAEAELSLFTAKASGKPHAIGLEHGGPLCDDCHSLDDLDEALKAWAWQARAEKAEKERNDWERTANENGARVAELERDNDSMEKHEYETHGPCARYQDRELEGE